jgi:hypothetical protein
MHRAVRALTLDPCGRPRKTADGGRQSWRTRQLDPFARLAFTVADVNPWLGTPEEYPAMKERVAKARNVPADRSGGSPLQAGFVGYQQQCTGRQHVAMIASSGGGAAPGTETTPASGMVAFALKRR